MNKCRPKSAEAVRWTNCFYRLQDKEEINEREMVYEFNKRLVKFTDDNGYLYRWDVVDLYKDNKLFETVNADFFENYYFTY